MKSLLFVSKLEVTNSTQFLYLHFKTYALSLVNIEIIYGDSENVDGWSIIPVLHG